MRLLVVEDDKKIASFIAKGLRQEGFAVDVAENGVDGFQLATSMSYDAAIIDIMLPKLDGLSMIEGMRSGGDITPVLILSARKSVDDRVKGLQKGGDDYLTKPFSFTELLARVQALIRRANAIAEPSCIVVRDLHIDLLRRKVSRAGKDIDLQPIEISLLAYLARNKGRIVSKTMIMEHVWGYDFDPQTNVVECRISRLRDKIDKLFDSALIKTVRGAGYVIE